MAEQFRVLVSDSLSETGLAPLLAAPNIKVDVRTDLTPQQLIEIIPHYDALLVRSSTQVTAEVLRAGVRLRVVGRAGVGVDNIDVDAATQAGVIVVNAPTGNVVAAAEHTIAMLMALARHIPQADAHVRAGLWKRNQFMGVEVRGKTLGTIGLGRVAQEVVRRAQGLGMRVLAYDPYVTAEYAHQRGVELTDLDTLVSRADFITLHVPLTPQTRNLINRERLALMQPTARLINVARGGIVDEQALVEAIESGRLAGAALDVFEQEPLPADSPLRRCPNIILSPHLGGSTVEAQEKVAEDVALQVLDVLNDRPARYAVNAPIIPPKDLEFLVPYIDLAERMGRFMKQLGAQGMGDVELTAEGDLAEFDLSYIRAAVIKGMLSDVVSVRVNLVNASLLAERRGMNLIERKKHQREFAYESLLTLRSTSGTQRWTVRGAVLQGEPHIVAINDLWVDFPASG
ncbi:MAG: phosphoglycerate dehydrogenase, partial [Caldilinea sp.]|nr:phosphoglycerate dehydrogenase [Caldilinea sp.]MDW8440084.1 phosphoglycerate dehydrogenase [Caldilineaceae bacterium]